MANSTSIEVTAACPVEVEDRGRQRVLHVLETVPVAIASVDRFDRAGACSYVVDRRLPPVDLSSWDGRLWKPFHLNGRSAGCEDLAAVSGAQGLLNPFSPLIVGSKALTTREDINANGCRILHDGKNALVRSVQRTAAGFVFVKGEVFQDAGFPALSVYRRSDGSAFLQGFQRWEPGASGVPLMRFRHDAEDERDMFMAELADRGLDSGVRMTMPGQWIEVACQLESPFQRFDLADVSHWLAAQARREFGPSWRAHVPLIAEFLSASGALAPRPPEDAPSEDAVGAALSEARERLAPSLESRGTSAQLEDFHAQLDRIHCRLEMTSCHLAPVA